MGNGDNFGDKLGRSFVALTTSLRRGLRVDAQAYPRFRVCARSVSWPLAGLILVGLVLSFSVADAQQQGWPTPPPGPQYPVPSQAQVDRLITKSVEVPGSEVAVIRPAWPGPLPVIPPVPSEIVHFADADLQGPPMTLRVDAGTFPDVVQVRVRGSEVNAVDASPSQALWAVEIGVFDADGALYRTPPQRPMEISFPVGAFAGAGIDPSYLSLVILDERKLMPIVSTYRASVATLTARLVAPGTIVLLRDLP